MDKGTWISTLDETIKIGNHKSALSKTERLRVTKLMEQDVELGYGITLTLECIRNLKDTEVWPVVIQNQYIINKKGDIIPKKRVTHNLYFNRKKGKSVNQRVREEEVLEVIFGH